MPLVRFKLAIPQSQVKHFTTDSLTAIALLTALHDPQVYLPLFGRKRVENMCMHPRPCYCNILVKWPCRQALSQRIAHLNINNSHQAKSKKNLSPWPQGHWPSREWNKTQNFGPASECSQLYNCIKGQNPEDIQTNKTPYISDFWYAKFLNNIWNRFLVLQQQHNLGRRYGTSKMHLSPPPPPPPPLVA